MEYSLKTLKDEMKTNNFNFKKMFGTGFKEYLTSVRMKAAVKLLKDSNLNVTQIAYRVGFNSQNHFCKIFKATFGISPLQYRKFS